MNSSITNDLRKSIQILSELFIGLGAGGMNLFHSGFYSGQAYTLSRQIIPVDFLDMLGVVHFFIGFFLLIYVLAICLSGRTISTFLKWLTLISLVATYTYWYMEKYSYLRIWGGDLNESQFEALVNSVGAFRGWDFYDSVTAFAVLFLYTISTVKSLSNRYSKAIH